jgi:LuxR family maltose regulon positive regulatory protein
VADLSSEVMLFLDDAHALPDETVRGPLAYLLLNAPPNLKVVLASRTRLELPVSDMMARGEYATVTTPTLHFRLEDTMALLRARFGDEVDADACALLQERPKAGRWACSLRFPRSRKARTATRRSARSRAAAATCRITSSNRCSRA